MFNIDIETCRECGGTVKVIACIEDSVVIEKILTHLQEKLTPTPAGLQPESRLADARDSRASGTGEGQRLDSQRNGAGFRGGDRASVPSLPVDDPSTSDQKGINSA